MTMAGEASRAGVPTLLVDVDPERNLSNRFNVLLHSTGLGNVFEDAGVTTGEGSADAGAKRLVEEIVETPWSGVELVPAGLSLPGVSQVNISDVWLLLRDMFAAAGLFDRYELILLDTGGRTGSLVTLAMYAADVAYAPIAPTTDAVRKALEARARVERIQRAHSLRWAGVVLSGFDARVGIEEAIRAEAYEQFGDQVRAEVPRRAVVNETFQLCERIGDRGDVPSSGLAKIFRGFLERDLMQREPVAALPAVEVLP
jgi:cellulose biosynthesis protein BcsQ